ncbi:MAG: histidine phosphatase family protein [Xenococcaceae cyanobacterium]
MITLSSQTIKQYTRPSLICPSLICNYSTPQTTKVILVRHGRSTYNQQGRYQGCSDESGLTEKGQQDAYRTGIVLKSVAIDAIYASPLQRVQQTVAEILNARREFRTNLPPVIISDKLKEINISPWQGLTYPYVQANFPQEYFYWKNYPARFKLLNPVTGRETFPVIDLYQQAQQFWQETLPQYQGKTILVVGHGGANRALINTALGIEPNNYNFLQQSNCGISLLEFTRQQISVPSSRLKALNLTAHLGKTLPKLKEGKQGLRLLLLATDSTEEQQQQLATFWQKESIDFILSDNHKFATPFLENLRPKRSQLLYLQIPGDRFLEVWRQQILTGKIKDSLATEKTLVTGLVTIDKTNLKKVIANLSSSYASVFQDNCLHIIHYPDLNRHPIFQAIAP